MTNKLSANSINTTVTLAHLCHRIEEILEEDISPEEKKYLKYVLTYSKKYFKSIHKRIDKEASDRLKRKVINYVPWLQPKYDNKRIVLDVDDFEDLSVEIIEERCKGCDGLKDCAIEKAFHDAFIPELVIPGKEDRPCLYSFTEDDLYDAVELKRKADPNYIEKYQKKKEQKKSKRQRAKKRNH